MLLVKSAAGEAVSSGGIVLLAAFEDMRWFQWMKEVLSSICSTCHRLALA